MIEAEDRLHTQRAFERLGQLALTDDRALAWLVAALSTPQTEVILCGPGVDHSLDDLAGLAALALREVGLRTTRLAMPLTDVLTTSGRQPGPAAGRAIWLLRSCYVAPADQEAVIEALEAVLAWPTWQLSLRALCTLELRGWQYDAQCSKWGTRSVSDACETNPWP